MKMYFFVRFILFAKALVMPFALFFALPQKRDFLAFGSRSRTSPTRSVGQKPPSTHMGKADVDCPTQVPGISSGNQLCL